MRRWAVVLGGSRGIGLACARALARQGFALCVVYRASRAEQPQVAAALDELRAAAPELLPMNTNAVTEAGMREVISALSAHPSGDQSVAVLIHSIAQGHLKPLAPRPQSTLQESGAESPPLLSSEDLALTIDAMGSSLQRWVAALFEQRLLAADTRVIAITSEGVARVWPGYAAVSAAKATLEALVRALAVEFGPYGVRANLVQAGITETRSLKQIPGHRSLLAAARARNPMGRLTRPEDVASAIELLCRPEAAWINGARLVVDGGEHLC